MEIFIYGFIAAAVELGIMYFCARLELKSLKRIESGAFRDFEKALKDLRAEVK